MSLNLPQYVFFFVATNWHLFFFYLLLFIRYNHDYSIDSRYIGNSETHFQEQLSRSYSLESPMEWKANQLLPTTYDHVIPRMRFSLNQQTNRQRLHADRANRLSLNHGAMHNSQVALRNRPVCLILFSISGKNRMLGENQRLLLMPQRKRDGTGWMSQA